MVVKPFEFGAVVVSGDEIQPFFGTTASSPEPSVPSPPPGAGPSDLVPEPALPPEPPPPPVPTISESEILEIQRRAYEDGFVQGERNGVRMGEEKLNAIYGRFEELFLDIATIKERLYREAEKEILTMSVEIARKIVRKAVKVDEEILLTLIRVTLGKVARHSRVRILLNPLDHVAITRSGEVLERYRSEFENLEVVPDEKIEQGGCLLETSSGIFDARIAEQFREVEQELLDLLPKG